MNVLLQLVLMTLCLSAIAQPPQTYTWSSAGCAKCQSTIVYQAWFPDKSPLVAEGMSAANAGALVALSRVKDTVVVSLGLRIARDPPMTLDLRQSVTIETNSSAHMVLYAEPGPGAGFHKDDVAVLRQLNSRSLPLRPHVPASGFLFFPFDAKAARFVVVVTVGSETFRFPFVPDPTAPGKFTGPANTASPQASQSPPGCSKNVSFVIADNGKLVARAPAFAGKWLEKHGAQYPGVCFSQTPDPRIANYLVAFAPSQAAFDEFSPTLRGQEPVWSYHYTGTAATTTTTTTYIGLPYDDQPRSLYAFTYDQTGRLISRRERAVATRREKGAGSNIGITVAAAIAASHLKERLLEDAVHDLAQ